MPQETFTFPSLHPQVKNAVSPHLRSLRFQTNGTTAHAKDTYETHIMGRFTCDNTACSTRGWGSKMIAIQIRGYPNNGYDAVVFNQRCKSCKRLGTLILDEQSYIERVAYRLKKWAEISQPQPHYLMKQGPPHERRLCEGCKRGVCKAGAWD